LVCFSRINFLSFLNITILPPPTVKDTVGVFLVRSTRFSSVGHLFTATVPPPLFSRLLCYVTLICWRPLSLFFITSPSSQLLFLFGLTYFCASRSPPTHFPPGIAPATMHTITPSFSALAPSDFLAAKLTAFALRSFPRRPRRLWNNIYGLALFT